MPTDHTRELQREGRMDVNLSNGRSPAVKPTPDEDAPDLLVLGGPLYRLFKFTGLLLPPLERTRLRIAVMIAATWLPLLVLTAMHRTAVGGVALPFLQDIQAHARFLVALPMILLTDFTTYTYLSPQASMFLRRGLIRDQDRARYDAAVNSTRRLRDSFILELISLLLVIGLRMALGQSQIASPESSWYHDSAGGRVTLTAAGRYYLLVALPILQFLMLRFAFRLLLWWRWLWKVSRLGLALNPMHPDRAGGLGFLALSVRAFMPALLAEGALLSGRVANAALYQHVDILAFKWEAVGVVLFLVLLVLFPLIFFTPQLLRGKRAGLIAYGTLASRYVSEFDTKWVRGGAPEGELLLGSADIQSLADLANSFSVVDTMRGVPFDRSAIIQTVLPILIPLLPLVFIVMPIDQLIAQIVKLVL
jgi:hypothetical protein